MIYTPSNQGEDVSLSTTLHHTVLQCTRTRLIVIASYIILIIYPSLHHTVLYSQPFDRHCIIHHLRHLQHPGQAFTMPTVLAYEENLHALHLYLHSGLPP